MSSVIAKQLSPVLSMSLYPSRRTSRQSPQDCNHTGRHCNHVHSRYRTALFSGVMFLLTLAVVLALSLSNPGVAGRAIVEGGWTDGSLLRRQASDSEESPFVRNKLYLAVLFGGLVLCVILGICLAAWCCKGSFENPLCCPCYCCALCGGLACLECIGCGLCAEAADQF